MKHTIIKSILALTVSAVMLCSCSAIDFVNEVTDRQPLTSAKMSKPVPSEYKYFASRLKEQDQKLYEDFTVLYNAIDNFEKKAELPNPISEEQANKLTYIINYDCPELIALNSEFVYWSNKDNLVTGIEIDYLMSESERTEKLKQMQSIVDGWASELDGKSELEKETYVYDFIYKNCEYDLRSKNSGTAFGCLAEGKARCEGYSKAFTYALRRLGIGALSVSGDAVDQKTGKNVKHAWNIVPIGGEYFVCDPTWESHSLDEQSGGKCAYVFFNMNDAAANIDRQIDSVYNSLGLPTCKTLTYNYQFMNGDYIKKGENVRTAVSEKLSEMYKSGERMMSLRFEDVSAAERANGQFKDTVQAWMNKNYVVGTVNHYSLLVNDCLVAYIDFPDRG